MTVSKEDPKALNDTIFNEFGRNRSLALPKGNREELVSKVILRSKSSEIICWVNSRRQDENQRILVVTFVEDLLKVKHWRLNKLSSKGVCYKCRRSKNDSVRSERPDKNHLL